LLLLCASVACGTTQAQLAAADRTDCITGAVLVIPAGHVAPVDGSPEQTDMDIGH